MMSWYMNLKKIDCNLLRVPYNTDSLGELGDGKPRIVSHTGWLTPVVLCGELIQILHKFCVNKALCPLWKSVCRHLSLSVSSRWVRHILINIWQEPLCMKKSLTYPTPTSAWLFPLLTLETVSNHHFLNCNSFISRPRAIDVIPRMR